VLVSSGENRPIALFSYLALLTAGGLVVARRRGWADLVGMALFGVVVLYGGWSERWHQPDQAPIALIAAGLLSSIFAWAGRAESEATRSSGCSAPPSSPRWPASGWGRSTRSSSTPATGCW